MLLHQFINQFEEVEANRKIKDHYIVDADGQARGEFLNHFLTSSFQPILKIQENKAETIGFESFLRPAAGDSTVSPQQFFTDLKEHNRVFVDHLSREIHLNNFFKQAHPGETISLNIFPTAQQNDMLQFGEIKAQLNKIAKLGLPSDRIFAELSLSPELDPGITYSISAQLQELGVKITLENFDADCASFSSVIFTRPNVVKFNRSWLNGNLTDSSYIDLVGDIVIGLKSVGAEAHLEKIESELEFQFAVATGFNYLQGYYFGKPSPQLIRQSIDLNF